MNAIDEVAVLDHLYLLNVEQPSEAWTREVQSPLSRDVMEQIERGAEAAHSAQMLGIVLIAGWLAFFVAVIWVAWDMFR